MAVNTLVKSIQNIMRQDTGVDGDAQRIGQLCWMFFLKIIDDQDQELKFDSPGNGATSSTAAKEIDNEIRSYCRIGKLMRSVARAYHRQIQRDSGLDFNYCILRSSPWRGFLSIKRGC